MLSPVQIINNLIYIVNDIYSLQYLEPTENGAVVLKIKIQIEKTSDNLALEQVDYLVSEYRYKNNMKQLVLATSGL